MNEALGLIEIRGLAASINVMDTMLKVASVELINIEKTKGSGWMTIKVSGNVGAVNASIEAGTAKAKESNTFVASKVIPRPMGDIAKQFLHKEEIQDEKRGPEGSVADKISEDSSKQGTSVKENTKLAQTTTPETVGKSAENTDDQKRPAVKSTPDKTGEDNKENGSPEKASVSIPKVQDKESPLVTSKGKNESAIASQSQDALEAKKSEKVEGAAKTTTESNLKSAATTTPKRTTQKKATRTTRNTTSNGKKTISSTSK
ncbi:BMC domain-containing protein [Desemzia sp. C1]|uniref:BMC domain-containing protein n=1 Tax=Desemzia sp. C1 TaxID=2892016 RepID=UPI001E648778|nr:BMC domain-containing protein [Desemzia sp. C1]MCI3029300.1 BMC domain-containing protein [Desemzia sp. C1]